MNILKEDVRASFNMNSSYENSCFENSISQASVKDPHDQAICTSPLDKHHQAHDGHLYNGVNDSCGTLSTPRRTESTKPFKCTLSPIGSWDIRSFKETGSQLKDLRGFDTLKFSATPISKNAVEFNFVESTSAPQQGSSKKDLSARSPLSLVLENIKARRSRKNVCFDTNVVSRSSRFPQESYRKTTPVVSLQPGKWRKSLNQWRRTQSIPSGNTPNPKNIANGEILGNTPNPKNIANGEILGNEHTNNPKLSIRKTVAGQRKSTLNRKKSSLCTGKHVFKRQLLRRCMQSNIAPFAEVYDADYLQNCSKIGEGAFGEVFLYTKPDGRIDDKTVLKIIPIEGKELINGEIQKSFEQILQEVVISMELCDLKDKSRKTSFADGFVNIERVRCVRGQYPFYLQKLWEDYDARKESENDHPECFTPYQQYVILEMTFSGEDLERFVFRNAEQSFYALHQIIYTLAVGEDVYRFEHRDLHWGNVLVLNTDDKYINYKLKDKIMTLPTKGVKITIIDYTLSRITYDNCCYYNDLSNDSELFTATGDYQFEIYRMMRAVLNDKWEIFEPKTNIFWLSYIISKMLDCVTYKNSRSKLHLQYMKKLRELNSTIMTYESSMDCANDLSSKL